MITRKVSPPGLLVPVGDPFFCERFLENGKRMAISRHKNVISLTHLTKKAPVRRGFLGSGIVPTGELEGREDLLTAVTVLSTIVPTGELEGREDLISTLMAAIAIVPTGELEGREDRDSSPLRRLFIVPTGELEGREDYR